MGPSGKLFLAATIAAAIAFGSCTKATQKEAASGPSRRLGLAILASGKDGLKHGEGGDLALAALEAQIRTRGGKLTKGIEEAEVHEPSGRAAGLFARCLSSKLGGRDGEQILRVLAEEGRDLIVAVGPSFGPALARVARDFPRTRFAWIGAPAGSDAASDNSSSISFDDAQGAFLVGALAGYMVAGENKPRLGFIGGADTAAARACQAAFYSGAAYAAVALRRPGSLLAQYCGPRGAAFADTDIARAMASSQYKKGAQIVFHERGASRRGLLEAASESGKLAMGSGEDTPREDTLGEDTPREDTLGEDTPGGAMIASIIERADVAMAILVDELFASGSVRGGSRLLGLKEGAVGYALDDTRKAMYVAFLLRIEELRAKVASGAIAVPSDDESAADFVRLLK